MQTMADNRVAYGLAKKYGTDTTGMSPKEVWEALNEKGIKPDGYDSKASVKTLSDRVEKARKEKDTEDEKVKNNASSQRFSEVKEVIKKIKSFEGKEEGTYDYESGKPVELKDGYMVTFHQNEPDKEGHYKSHYGRYTAEEYDEMTSKFAKENDAKIFVGVFDGEPEISFKVKTFEQAKKLMIKYNQMSLWNNEGGFAFPNEEHYDKTKNPMRGD